MEDQPVAWWKMLGGERCVRRKRRDAPDALILSCVDGSLGTRINYLRRNLLEIASMIKKEPVTAAMTTAK
jgi:hypothetical protein